MQFIGNEPHIGSCTRIYLITTVLTCLDQRITTGSLITGRVKGWFVLQLDHVCLRITSAYQSKELTAY